VDKKTTIEFIINPKSGTQQKAHLPELIHKFIDSEKFKITILKTEGAGHAKILAQNASQKNIDIVAIAGGDGSINEAAAGLINSTTCLAIIPMGSGNGLARHLGLPLSVEKAINKINSGKKDLIDTCLINNETFVSASGVGFDGLVAHEFSKTKKRGIAKYVTISSQNFFGYKPRFYQLIVDGKSINTDAFMIAFANSQQFGSGLKIAPTADLKDGLMHCCILKPFGILSGAKLLFDGFSGKLKSNAYYDLIDCKEAIIEFPDDVHWQKDGEPMHYKNKVEIKINPKSLWVWM
jgi:YegS/Rv2252/BmrU family lipid kinase